MLTLRYLWGGEIWIIIWYPGERNHIMWDTVPLSEEQSLIKNEIQNICSNFDHEYWRVRDKKNEYPQEFAEILAENGWLGILIPEKYGGAGMGTSEAMVMLEEISANGAGFGGAQAIHGAIYTSAPVIKHAGEDLKSKLLPDLASGDKMMQAFGLTEPNAGLDSTSIETTAERDGDTYVINGQKIWTSRLDVSDYYLVVARTQPKEEVEKKTQGISLFVVDMDDAKSQGAINYESIEKTSVNLSHSFEVWFDDLEVPASQIVGQEGDGFYCLLDGLNAERLVGSAEAVGLGRLAIERASEYATSREVFDRPIGKNQAIQHPLAKSYAEVLAAKEVVYSSAAVLDEINQKDAGIRANVAKYLSAKAAFNAADAAVQTHGGFGVAREFDVERYLRDARIIRIAPISQELALCYIAETALNLPRSY